MIPCTNSLNIAISCLPFYLYTGSEYRIIYHQYVFHATFLRTLKSLSFIEQSIVLIVTSRQFQDIESPDYLDRYMSVEVSHIFLFTAYTIST
jgi:hypothetical protein